MHEPATDRALASIQRRFYDLATTGAGDPDGLIAGGDPGIYAGMYAARLFDVLAEDYPKLRAALGDDRFGAVVRGYLRACPPSSFTLRDAGLALAGFLARLDADLPPWAAELAQLERARTEVFDGPDAAPLDLASVAALAADDVPALELCWVPASAVLALTWTADDLWSAIEDGRPPDEPTGARRVVLVWRKGPIVFHRTLDDDEAALAPELTRGLAFAEACARLAAHGHTEPAARAAVLLARWLDAEALRASRARGADGFRFRLGTSQGAATIEGAVT